MGGHREYFVTGPPKMAPIYPALILREDVLPYLGLSVTAAARQMGVSRQTLHRILAGTHGITPEMALRIGKFCGNGPGLWLRMQQSYDLWHAERRMRAVLKRIATQREPVQRERPHRRAKSA